jgi:hypothetical protein
MLLHAVARKVQDVSKQGALVSSPLSVIPNEMYYSKVSVPCAGNAWPV